MNIQVSCHTMTLNPLGTYPGVSTQIIQWSIFTFFEESSYCFPQGLYEFIFLPSLYRGLSFSTSQLAFVVESFLQSSQNQSARSLYSACHPLSIFWMYPDGRALRFEVFIISPTFLSSSNISRPFSEHLGLPFLLCNYFITWHVHFYNRNTSQSWKTNFFPRFSSLSGEAGFFNPFLFFLLPN